MMTCPDGNIERTAKQDLNSRVAFLEHQKLGNIDAFLALPEDTKKIVKTHLPATLCENWMSNGAKFVVTMRNPKDTLVSLYHFYKGIYSMLSISFVLLTLMF